jgi:hypothetical protein
MKREMGKPKTTQWKACEYVATMLRHDTWRLAEN